MTPRISKTITFTEDIHISEIAEGRDGKVFSIKRETHGQARCLPNKDRSPFTGILNINELTFREFLMRRPNSFLERINRAIKADRWLKDIPLSHRGTIDMDCNQRVDGQCLITGERCPIQGKIRETLDEMIFQYPGRILKEEALTQTVPHDKQIAA